MLLRGAYCFALQIYGDFSGYSDIARGVSELLGVRLMQELQAAVPVAVDHRVLAPLAHLAVVAGCATTCTSRSAAIATARGRRTAT